MDRRISVTRTRNTRRPGEWSRTEARKSIVASIRRNWPAHLIVLGMSLAMAALYAVWPISDWWRGFAVGAICTAMICGDLWYMVGDSQGAFWRLQGADAETLTA